MQRRNYAFVTMRTPISGITYPRLFMQLLRDLPKYSVQSPLPQIFQNSKNIRRINLANNTLRAIDYRSFSHLKKLNEVLLSENPWR